MVRLAALEDRVHRQLRSSLVELGGTGTVLRRLENRPRTGWRTVIAANAGVSQPQPDKSQPRSRGKPGMTKNRQSRSRWLITADTPSERIVTP
ncbi:protein of unknown function [Micropruina glycogenica]|uniref:Uncharacterized protein n=1 Tax=Micropruina glycogenica TaxID=75385 RepID=A0A2N9JHQ3_9ACTN|nr:protein of unknown function [Micropruina glycogenica]